MPPTYELRHIHLKGAVGELRTESFMGRDHKVVPVIMLMEGVVWPANSETPEFVPLETLAVAPWQWDGAPILTNHPSVNGQMASGNTPLMLETMMFGTVFNARIKDTALVAEAWLDTERADAIGAAAQRYLERLQDPNDQIEVSVGATVVVEKKKGEFHGQKYGSIWREVYRDHLAFLPEGKEGACSLAMGCGAPRALMRHLVTKRGLKKEQELMSKTRPLGDILRGLTSEAARWLRFRSTTEITTAEGTSDQELRRELYDQLYAIEPGFLGIDAVFPTDKLVIYACAPQEGIVLWRRSYTEDTAGNISLNDDRVQVEPVTSYEPVNGEMKAASAAKPCGCGGTATAATPTSNVTPQSVTANQSAASAQEDAMHKYDERITALISNNSTPWREVDRKHLQTLDEDRLREIEEQAKQSTAAFTALEAQRTAAEQRNNSGQGPQGTPNQAGPQGTQQGTSGQQVQQPAATPAAPAAGQQGAQGAEQVVNRETERRDNSGNTGVELSEDEYLRIAPESIRNIVLASRHAADEKRRTLLSAMKSNNDVLKAFKPEQLDAYNTEDLERIAALAGIDTTGQVRGLTGQVVDFAGRGNNASQRGLRADTSRAPEPPSMYAKVKELQSGRK